MVFFAIIICITRRRRFDAKHHHLRQSDTCEHHPSPDVVPVVLGGFGLTCPLAPPPPPPPPPYPSRRASRILLRLLFRQLSLKFGVKTRRLIRHLQRFFVDPIGGFFVERALKARLGLLEELPAFSPPGIRNPWR